MTEPRYYVCRHCIDGRHASCVVMCRKCEARCLCHLQGHK